MKSKSAIVLLLNFLLISVLCGADADTNKVDDAANSNEHAGVPAAVNDRRLHEGMLTEAQKLFESGRAEKMPELIAQLQRNSCSLKLPKPPTKTLALNQVYD